MEEIDYLTQNQSKFVDPWLNASPIDQNTLLSLIHLPNPSQTFSLPTEA